ncbi:MAG TPA: hypothetical protein VNI20_06575 [Fimbriimonadaceae bacterium]|nr:hypothetical protein [Fimbriimonadaceae bacterium]
MIDLDSPQEFLDRRMRSVDRRRLLVPRDPQQVVDFSVRLYHKLAWPILRLTIPSMILLYAGLIFFQGFVIPGLMSTSHPNDIKIQFSEVMVVYGVALFVALPVVVIALSYTVGLTTRLASSYILEQRIDLDEGIAAARKGAQTMVGLLLHVFLRAGIILMLAGSLFMVSAYFNQSGYSDGMADLAGSFAFLGMISGFIAAPLVMSRMSLAPAAATIENLGAREAMSRSALLLKKARHIPSGYETLLKIWGISLLVGLILWGGFQASFAMAGVSAFVNEYANVSIGSALLAETLRTLPSFAALWIVTPFVACGCTVTYFDRRVRLEALDIETMAHDVLQGTETADLRL